MCKFIVVPFWKLVVFETAAGSSAVAALN